MEEFSGPQIIRNMPINHCEVSPHLLEWLSYKNHKTIHADEEVRKIGGNGNWCKFYDRQCGDSSEM